jgi:hypothetical protein
VFKGGSSLSALLATHGQEAKTLTQELGSSYEELCGFVALELH